MSTTIFGIQFNSFAYEELIARIENALRTREQISVAGPHFSIILQAQADARFRAILNQFTVCHPDGLGSCFALSLLSKKMFQRLNGTDLYRLLLRNSSLKNRRTYFLGGTQETAEKLKEMLHAYGLGNESTWTHHGYFEEGDRTVLDEINAAQPDVLFVGLGSPRQFEWIHQHKKSLNVPVIMAIGGGIEFLAKRKARAPRWMRRVGLEWLHRLYLEPRRLWRRYLLGIPYFLFLILREKIKQR